MIVVVGALQVALLLDQLLVGGAATGTIMGAILAPSTPAILLLIVLIPAVLFQRLAYFKRSLSPPLKERGDTKWQSIPYAV